MDDTILRTEMMMDSLCQSMGDYAPRRRRLVADYKDRAGQDFHRDLVTWHNWQATDEALVQSVRESLAENGCSLTALAEYGKDGAARVLYLAPGCLEEFAAEMGLIMPEDVAAALTAAAVHPVNWEELTHGKQNPNP